MGRIRLKQGIRFTLYGEPHRISKEFPGPRFLCQSEISGAEDSLTMPMFLQLMDQKHIKLILQKQRPIPAPIEAERELTDMELKRSALRLRVVMGMEGKSTQELREWIDGLRRKGEKVSLSRAYEWRKIYLENNCDARALALSDSRKGRGQGARLHDDIEKVIAEKLDECYFIEEKRSLQSITLLVRHEIHEINQREGTSYEYPSRATISRRARALEDERRARKRLGKDRANAIYSNVNYVPRPTQPHEVCEIDHAIIDCQTYDSIAGTAVGKMCRTEIVDKYSGYVLGCYVGYEDPSHVTAAYALANMIESKEWVKEKYPDIQHDWHSFGLPQTLVCDNAKHFRSENFNALCQSLGIQLIFTAPGRPEGKGKVERHFGVENSLFHSLPGTTRSNVQERGRYPSEKKAKLTADDIRELHLQWLLDIYHIRYSKGVKGIPEKLYLDGISPPYPKPEVPDFPDWKIHLGKIEFRQLRRVGIEFDNEVYPLSPEVSEFRRELLKLGRGNEKVKFKYHPDDISTLYVFNEFTGKYLELVHPNPKFKGLSQHVHNLIHKGRLAYHVENKDDLARGERAIVDKVKQRGKENTAYRKSKARIEEDLNRHIAAGGEVVNTKPQPERESVKVKTSGSLRKTTRGWGDGA